MIPIGRKWPVRVSAAALGVLVYLVNQAVLVKTGTDGTPLAEAVLVLLTGLVAGDTWRPTGTMAAPAAAPAAGGSTPSAPAGGAG